MNELLGNAVVLAVLALIVGLAVRSLWKNRGHHCDGNCGNCHKCKSKS